MIIGEIMKSLVAAQEYKDLKLENLKTYFENLTEKAKDVEKLEPKGCYSEEDLKYAYEQGKLYSHICYSRTFENVLEIIKIKKK